MVTPQKLTRAFRFSSLICSLAGPGLRKVALTNINQWRVMTPRFRYATRFCNPFVMFSTSIGFQMFRAASCRRGEDECSLLLSDFYSPGAKFQNLADRSDSPLDLTSWPQFQLSLLRLRVEDQVGLKRFCSPEGGRTGIYCAAWAGPVGAGKRSLE